MLESLIAPKPPIRLVEFFINTTETGYLRDFTEVVNKFSKAILKELNILCEAGYLKKEAIQNRIFCKTKNLLFVILQKNNFPTFLTRCHSYDAFGAHGSIERIVVIGDYINGK